MNPSILDSVLPTIFKGGPLTDYEVFVMSNGGLGTRHIPTGTVVPHVIANPDFLQTGEVLLEGMQHLQALSVANLAVSVVNLGVSTWTAIKVHKMDKKIDVVAGKVDDLVRGQFRTDSLITESTRHLEGLIQQNSAMLGVLADIQSGTRHDVSLLRMATQQGFMSVLQTMGSIEARRQADELEQQMRAVLRYYTICTDELAKGAAPPRTDLRRIIDKASDLVAWLDTRMKPLDIGHPQRLPLLTAKAFALRLESEARQQLDEGLESREAEISEFCMVLQREACVLTENASLYVLAEERAILIKQYVLLVRALKEPVTTVALSDGTIMPYYPTALSRWDGGVVCIREELQGLTEGRSVNMDESIPLLSLEEHGAWVQLTGELSGSSVKRSMLTQRLGIPDSLSPHIAMQTLRNMLLIAPTAAQELRRTILNETSA